MYNTSIEADNAFTGLELLLDWKTRMDRTQHGTTETKMAEVISESYILIGNYQC